MDPKNRRTRVVESTSVNGIDFVEIADDLQQVLLVHFLNAVGGPTPPDPSVPLVPTLDDPAFTITGGERIPTVEVQPIQDADWALDDGHLVVTLRVAAPGDFSWYTLTIHQQSSLPASSPQIDPFFGGSVFSFKARCPSDLDCQPAAAACPVPPADTPPIDYLAKDFLSFRQALLDFSALRYPEWQERSEADFGVMFAEALCALADELSYMQDRIAVESALETATQRRSVVRLARLVDYEPHPTVAAAAILQFDVADTVTGIPDGLLVSAPGPDGTPIPFETGTGLLNRLIDPVTSTPRLQPPQSKVRSVWNRGMINPYLFDDSQRCLRAGSTQMYVLGRGFGFYGGQSLLIETDPDSTADPPIRQIVRLLGGDQAPVEFPDPLSDPPAPSPDGQPAFDWPGDPHATAVTLIRWRDADALTVDRDLTRTRLAGNLLLATAGATQLQEPFYIPDPGQPVGPPPQGIPAIVRTGPNDTPTAASLQFLYTMRSSPLAWIQPDDAAQGPRPELVLIGLPPGGEEAIWRFQRWLLDAGPFDATFTLDPARFSPVAPGPGGSPRFDYDGDAGDTIRFGDGVFGAVPLAETSFTVQYRAGGGAVGNVAADAITSFNPGDTKAAGVIRVSNPLPASGGADPESLDSVRSLAPQAIRAVQYRAVLPADYQAAAETLPWVQRAGTVFRWTGSWLTVFTTPDPLGTESLSLGRRTQLIDLLNRYRMAGYESYVPDPRYVALDLVVEVCARPDAFRGDVERAVLDALRSSPGGFFAPDRFTFSQPLERSALEAAVQRAYGVSGVTCVEYRIRGRTRGFVPMGDAVGVGTDEIVRCDNDPSLPEHGSLRLIIEGGK